VQADLTAINPAALEAARAAAPTDELLTVVVEMFSALADPTRPHRPRCGRDGETHLIAHPSGALRSGCVGPWAGRTHVTTGE